MEIAAGSGLALLLAVVVGGQVRVSNRAPPAAVVVEQGNQKTEVHLDSSSGIVTLKFSVQDQQGHFIPNIRRENFAVYEDSVRQTDATVSVEHAAISAGLLMEHGGRRPALIKDFAEEVSRAGHQLLKVLGRDDKVAIWTYADSVKQLAGFSQGRETLDKIFFSPDTPELSETNLYDALLAVLGTMRQVQGAKAIILISSGIDTFSKSNYDDVLVGAKSSNTPIYVIYMGLVLRVLAQLNDKSAAIGSADVDNLERKLREIAKTSGGRLYSPESTIDLSPIYDDIMENLKVRYVITYKSSQAGNPGAKHTVRVEVVNPTTGKPLEITDADGRPINPKAIAEGAYTSFPPVRQ
jgi:Ca-activated chloride channel family protein